MALNDKEKIKIKKLKYLKQKETVVLLQFLIHLHFQKVVFKI